MAERVRWPGFAPGEIPLALHDGSTTYLIRHPSPPEPFRRLRGFSEAYAADTVLAELRANTAARIAGVWAATVLAPEGAWDERSLAPLLVHEAFHVFQTVEHPSWTANEVDLFTYPVRSQSLLQLRRLETAALRRAVTAPDSVRELCWAQAFLRSRKGRFRGLPAEAAAYDRGTELREGLARYVQAKASGEAPRLPGDGFAPEDVRERAYASGHALAVLLDRLSPGWKDEMDDPERGLDGVLDDAIGTMRVRHCGPSPDEVGRSRTVARNDLRLLAERDTRARSAFDQTAGWRVEIDAALNPLFPKQFDPLNVRILSGREVLHERWIQLSNGVVELEVLGHVALTRGVGPHPMFDGIDRIEVTGLPEPEVAASGDTIRIVGPGITMRIVGADVDRGERRVLITLPPPD